MHGDEKPYTSKGGLTEDDKYYDYDEYDDEDYYYPDPGSDLSKFRLYMCKWIESGQTCKMGRK